MLTYPQCLRGNIPLSETMIDAVLKFYCEDGISRVSSNSKDTLKRNGQAIAVRFMEMTILDAYRIFNERFPETVARSTFYMCIIHENMDLLLKVRKIQTLTRLYHIFTIGLE
jgi:hypothetical protein